MSRNECALMEIPSPDCEICYEGEFKLCKDCGDKPGIYCDEPSHWRDHVKKYTETDTQGNCARVVKPLRKGQTIVCSRCRCGLGALFFHCCFCEQDDFDMCLSCVLDVKSCRKPWSLQGHPLEVCRRTVS